MTKAPVWILFSPANALWNLACGMLREAIRKSLCLQEIVREWRKHRYGKTAVDESEGSHHKSLATPF
jgi:hypothetical protein